MAELQGRGRDRRDPRQRASIVSVETLANREQIQLSRSVLDSNSGGDTHDFWVMSATIRIDDAFGLQVLAEGVESPEQRNALAELGCDLAQGYLWARPVFPEAPLRDDVRQWIGSTARAVTL